MAIAPGPSVWRDLGDWEYRRAGVTPQRVRTLRVVAAAASAIERTAEVDGGAAEGVLRSLPGVGVWTAAEVRQRAHGDADAISFGDFHVAKDVCWWLTGAVGDDARMAELLTPYTGHRYRVQRLMELSGFRRPRRGPRMPVPTHR
jgi:3-methyladenine DNA glycosylase/8-oxoguanine DNA glycosylase